MMFSAFVSSGCHQMQTKAKKFHFSSYNATNNLQILLFSPPEIIIDSTSSVYPKKIFRRKQHVERRTDFNCFLNGFSKKRKKGEKRIFFFFCADFHLSAFIFAASQIALAASSTSATDSGEKTNRFFWHQKATFLS